MKNETGNGKISGSRNIDDNDDSRNSQELMCIVYVCLFKLSGLNVMIPYNIHSSNDSSYFPLVIVSQSLVGIVIVWPSLVDGVT